jgi:hypothetical protein
MVKNMERDSFDDYFAHHLKQELLTAFLPTGGKAKLLSRVVDWRSSDGAAWSLLPRRGQNLYRVHVYRGAAISDRVDCLMASYALEFGMLNQQHMFS